MWGASTARATSLKSLTRALLRSGAVALALGDCTELHRFPNADIVPPLLYSHETKGGFRGFKEWPRHSGQTHQQGGG